jgi:hypothetical protein
MGAKTGYADPRALWDRLRAEGAPSGVTGREVGRWLWVQGHGDSSKPPRLASPYAKPEGNADGQWKAPPPGWLADRADRIPALPATIHPAAIDPREVARWTWLHGRSFNNRGPDAGFLPSESANGVKVWNAHPPAYFARMWSMVPALPATLHPTAIPPQANARGAVVYIDPPYQNTTGYAHDLPRAEVERLALAWAEAGATVAISEAEPIAMPGWEHVEITGERKGQKRTFSRQQSEWLTIWRAP